MHTAPGAYLLHAPGALHIQNMLLEHICYMLLKHIVLEYYSISFTIQEHSLGAAAPGA